MKWGLLNGKDAVKVLHWMYMVAQTVKCLPAVRETRVRSLGWEDPLEKEMATHSSNLAWKIPWTEEPGGLQSMGSQRVGHDWATSLQICQQIWKTQQWPQDWKRSVFTSISKKGNAKDCSNYHTVFALISHASKVMLKILQVRLQQYMKHELQMFKLILGKAKEAEIKFTTYAVSLKKQKISPPKKTHMYFCFIDCVCGYRSLWLCGSQQTVENSLRDGNTRPPDLPLEKPVCRSGSNS